MSKPSDFTSYNELVMRVGELPGKESKPGDVVIPRLMGFTPTVESSRSNDGSREKLHFGGPRPKRFFEGGEEKGSCSVEEEVEK